MAVGFAGEIGNVAAAGGGEEVAEGDGGPVGLARGGDEVYCCGGFFVFFWFAVAALVVVMEIGFSEGALSFQCPFWGGARGTGLVVVVVLVRVGFYSFLERCKFSGISPFNGIQRWWCCRCCDCRATMDFSIRNDHG